MNFWVNNLTCFVWRPSTGTLVDHVLFGYNAPTASGTEGGNSETVSQGHFATPDQSVVCQSGDVLVVQMTSSHAQSMATAYTGTFYFDGATVNTTENASVSDHASFVEFANTLTWASAGVTFDAAATASSTASATTLTVGMAGGALAQATATGNIYPPAQFEVSPQSRNEYTEVANTPNLISTNLFRANNTLFLVYDPLVTDSAYRVDTSTDGDTWTAYDLPLTRAASAPSGTRLGVVGDGTYFYAWAESGVARATVLSSWTTLTNAPTMVSSNFRHMASGNGKLIIVDQGSLVDQGKMHTSADSGDTWSTTSSSRYYNVWFCNGLFFRQHDLGQTGTPRIDYSSDGSAWTDITTTSELTSVVDVVYVAGRYVFACSGKFVSSTDFVSWIVQATPSSSVGRTSVVNGVATTALSVDLSGGVHDYDQAITEDGISWDFTIKGALKTGHYIVPLDSSRNITRNNPSGKPCKLALVKGSRAISSVIGSLTTLPIPWGADSVADSAAAGALSTQTRFSSSASSSSSVSGSLATAVLMAGSGLSAAAQTSALTTEIALAASVAGVSSQTASITTQIQLAASQLAVASATAAFEANAANLEANAATESAGSADLVAQIRLGASSAAMAVTTSDLSTEIRLSAAPIALATAAAQATTAILFDASAGAVAASSSALASTSAQLASSVVAVSFLSGDITVAARLASAIAAVSSATADLLTQTRFDGLGASTALSSADLTTQILLNSGVTVLADSAATLQTSILFGSANAGDSAALGALTVAARFAAGTTSVATLSGEIGFGVALAGDAPASASTSADISTQVLLVASVVAGSTVQGGLGTGVLLDAAGQAAGASTAGASLLTLVGFGAQAASVAQGAGVLGTEIRLESTAATSGQVQAALTALVTMESAAAAQPDAFADLNTVTQFASLADVAAYAYADLATEILLQSEASGQAELSAALSQVLSNLGMSGFTVVVPAELRLVSVPANERTIVVQAEVRSVMATTD